MDTTDYNLMVIEFKSYVKGAELYFTTGALKSETQG